MLKKKKAEKKRCPLCSSCIVELFCKYLLYVH